MPDARKLAMNSVYGKGKYQQSAPFAFAVVDESGTLEAFEIPTPTDRDMLAALQKLVGGNDLELVNLELSGVVALVSDNPAGLTANPAGTAVLRELGSIASMLRDGIHGPVVFVGVKRSSHVGLTTDQRTAIESAYARVFAAMETTNVDDLSDTVRALVIPDGCGGEITVYRQAGGCLEISQTDDGRQDIVHVCDPAAWQALRAAMEAVATRVPPRL